MHQWGDQERDASFEFVSAPPKFFARIHSQHGRNNICSWYLGSVEWQGEKREYLMHTNQFNTHGRYILKHGRHLETVHLLLIC
jgi:hypothetical protein